MDSSKISKQSSKVTVLQRKKYGCFCKIFCCKCAYCCQSFDFSLLTSEHRKGVFLSMIIQYIKQIESQPNIIIDPFFILIGLLLGEQDKQINKVTLLQIGDGNSNNAIFSMQDLQMYIPQICTYLVFHEQMQNIPIFNLMQKTARFDIQFALLYYFYMRSLEIIRDNHQFQIVTKYNSTFVKKIDCYFKMQFDGSASGIFFNGFEDHVKMYNQRDDIKGNSIKLQKLNCNPVRKLYKSCFVKDSNIGDEDEFGVFRSSMNFLDDLIEIGHKLLKQTDRKATLTQCLKQMNKQLPADIYLPFKNKRIQGMKVASIVFEQCRIFSTKMRVPYYICIQVYEQKINIKNSAINGINGRIVSTVNMNQSLLKKSYLFQQDTMEQEQQYQQQIQVNRKYRESWVDKVYKLAKSAQKFYKSKVKQQTQTDCQIKIQNQQDDIQGVFGESQIAQEARIKEISPFANLDNHHLVHFIVKIDDDLRQEAFAMQLLSQFNEIFKIENLPIYVVPYQVIPLDYNCGLIEYLKDSLTIDELRKKSGSLQFIKTNKNKLDNFMWSLVGYSLVTYLLQVKDRHNGNIMIRRDGAIIHIDFGYFMSNAPGQGVELERNVAFKMTNEYIDILGGVESKMFHQFRKLVFLGYQACRKHQHRILILTKLMYSSHGTTMPCFVKGNLAITGLQDRINPPTIHTDGDLMLHSQNLINKSIDNWRARWYDKWQYYMEGILY